MLCSERDVMKDFGIPAWLPLNDAVSLVGPCIAAGAFSDPLNQDNYAAASFKDEQTPLGFNRSG